MKVAGTDVWKGRWVVVVVDDGRYHHAFVTSTLGAVLEEIPDVAVIGVDMPIGLPAPGTRRPADELARKYVGPRWQSVFMTPPLEILEADTHEKANQVAAAGDWDGISAQAYGLRRMILQVQPVAQADDRVYEVHPEVSFVRANAQRHLLWSKTSWNGVSLRRRVLQTQGILIPDDLGSAGAAGLTDVLDASIAAWSAGRIAAGEAKSLPAGANRIGAIWG
jgi:predicted RNase H-like nuclease